MVKKATSIIFKKRTYIAESRKLNAKQVQGFKIDNQTTTTIVDAKYFRHSLQEILIRKT